MNEAVRATAPQRAERWNAARTKPVWLSALLTYALIVGVAALSFYVVHVRGNEARLNRLALRSLQSMPTHFEQYTDALGAAVGYSIIDYSSEHFIDPEPNASDDGPESQRHAKQLFNASFPAFAASEPTRASELYPNGTCAPTGAALQRFDSDWYLVVRIPRPDNRKTCIEIRTPLRDLVIAPDALDDFDQVLLASPDGEVLYQGSRVDQPPSDVWLGLRRFRDEFSAFVGVDTAPREPSSSPLATKAATAKLGLAPIDAGELAKLLQKEPGKSTLDSTETVVKRELTVPASEPPCAGASTSTVETCETRQSKIMASDTALERIRTALILSASARRGEAAALGSFIVDENIGGQNYRVFVQPYQLRMPIVSAESVAPADRMYVVGIVTREKLVREMLSTSAPFVLLLAIVIAALVCLLP